MGGEANQQAFRRRATATGSSVASVNVRQTRAARKRSAMEGSCVAWGSTVLHPRKHAAQPSGRRAPLTDISKLVNAGDQPSDDTRSPELKPIAEDVAFEASSVCRAAMKPTEVFSDSGASLISTSALASLERRTSQRLFISKESRDTLKRGERHKSSEPTSSWSFHDIDTDHTDPQMCSTYAADIYVHLRTAEIKRRPMTNFMEALQKDITPTMRGILIDWLVEVAEEYKLVPDTLYLTVAYIDRFLSSYTVTRQRLQLLGVSCMLIAAKYEEICSPQVNEFCYITDNTYQRDEILDMERKVLRELKFELTTPTIKSFLRRFVRAAQVSGKTPTLALEFLGNYLSELTLMEYGFLGFVPSIVAASAVYMAKLTLDPSVHPWNTSLRHYTGYKASELEICVRALYKLQTNSDNCTLPAIRDKYRQQKFKCVATLTPPSALLPDYFKDVEPC